MTQTCCQATQTNVKWNERDVIRIVLIHVEGNATWTVCLDRVYAISCIIRRLAVLVFRMLQILEGGVQTYRYLTHSHSQEQSILF